MRLSFRCAADGNIVLRRAEKLYLKAVSASGMTYRNGKITRREEDETQYSKSKVAYDYTKSFSEQIDDFKKGNFPEKDTFVLGSTPKIYREIGFNALPLTINRTHVDYALNGTKDANHYLGESLLKQLPKAIENPIAIVSSKTKNKSSVVAIVSLKHRGNMVIAPIYIDGFGFQNGIQIDSNAITSVHARNNAITGLLKDAISQEANGKIGIFYYNKKEADPLVVGRVSMPHGLQGMDGFVHSIREKGSTVKIKMQNVTE
jgi:hypothetical protein